MKYSVITAAVVACLGATSASAATLDFYGEATVAPGYERGVSNGTTVVMDGVNVTFDATYDDGVNGVVDAYAYFDSGAGLGVCKVLNSGDQCVPSNDDNVTFGESVTLSFDDAQDLSDMIFFAEGHGPDLTTETLLFSVNGGTLTEYTFTDLSGASFDNVTSITFAYGGTGADQFYLNSATVVASVPLPATLPLLAGALLLLRRRRKAAA